MKTSSPLVGIVKELGVFDLPFLFDNEREVDKVLGGKAGQHFSDKLAAAGFRGKDGTEYAKGDVNPRQLEQYIENGCFWRDHLPPEQHWYKHANQAYLDNSKAMGFIPKAEQIVGGSEYPR